MPQLSMGERLTQLALQAEIPLAELACIAGASPRVAQEVETGTVSRADAAALADTLHVSLIARGDGSESRLALKHEAFKLFADAMRAAW